MDSPQKQAPDIDGGLSPGDVIAGKFRLDRVIGRGGMGAVWAARHLQLDMPVALKFIEAEQGSGPDAPEARVRFEREARAAGQIRSPHVVQMIDHGIDTGGGRDRPYIAMELLEGEDLGQRLQREGRIPLAAASHMLGQAAKALRRAHESGIIHRDLKPENVFLARFDDDEVVKLLDFGVAKMRRAGVLEEQLATQTGIVFGSPSYMSPEQARGKPIDHRSDLWSLAVIVFRAVTGVKPFQATSIADLVIKLCIDPLPVATQVAPDLPPEVDRFFTRAFAREPEQRFATAIEMAAAFEVAAAAGPTPQAASPEPPANEGAVHDGAPPQTQVHDEPLPQTPAVPGSGSHIAFAPGTLTPPPAPIAPALPASSPSSAAPAAAEIPEPRPAPTAAPRRALRAALYAVSAPERAPLVLVTSLGGGLVIAILLAVVARQGPRDVAPAAAVSAAPAMVSEIPAAPPPPSATVAAPASAEPAPEPSASAATTAEPTAPEPSDAASSEPAPTSSAGAPPRPPPWRYGKKKKPNFGY